MAIQNIILVYGVYLYDSICSHVVYDILVVYDKSLAYDTYFYLSIIQSSNNITDIYF